jgi:hypothetical protein
MYSHGFPKAKVLTSLPLADLETQLSITVSGVLTEGCKFESYLRRHWPRRLGDRTLERMPDVVHLFALLSLWTVIDCAVFFLPLHKRKLT